jgi:ABC-type lipoprotein export system ATPase subunit
MPMNWKEFDDGNFQYALSHGENYIKKINREQKTETSVVLLGVTGAGKSTLLSVAENDKNPNN